MTLCFATNKVTYKAGKTYPDLPAVVTEIWWQSLHDVPEPVLREAFRLACAGCEYGFPPVGKVRDWCAQAAINGLETPVQAWALIRHALLTVAPYDSNRERNQQIIADLPPLCRMVLKRFGVFRLQQMDGDKARQEFCREYERAVAAERSRLMRPGRWPKTVGLPAPDEAKRLEN